MTRFLSVEDVVTIHDDTIAREGGSAGHRDHGLLESAVATPMQQFGGVLLHEDLAAQACAYLYHFAKNHPVPDGNKRTAAMSTLVFLAANEVTTLPDPVAMEQVTLDVAAGKTSKPEVIDWLRQVLAS